MIIFWILTTQLCSIPQRRILLLSRCPKNNFFPKYSKDFYRTVLVAVYELRKNDAAS